MAAVLRRSPTSTAANTHRAPAALPLAAALHTEGNASLVDKTLPFKMSYRPFDKEIILLRSSRSRGKTPNEITSADGRIAVGKNEREGCNLAAGKRLHWFLVDFKKKQKNKRQLKFSPLFPACLLKN